MPKILQNIDIYYIIGLIKELVHYYYEENSSYRLNCILNNYLQYGNEEF